MLGLLQRDELKAVCERLGLDASGREKNVIVSRIMTSGAQRDGSGSAAPGGAAPASAFALSPPEPKERKARAPASARSGGGEPTADYRHDAKRKNNPPAGLVELEKPPPQPTRKYAYDPHLDPQLQWAGKAEHGSRWRVRPRR